MFHINLLRYSAALILLSTAINAVQGFRIQLYTKSPLTSEAFQDNVSEAFQGNVSEAIQGMDTELAWTDGPMNKSDLEESFDRLNRQSQLKNKITKKAPIMLSTAINAVQGFRIQLDTESSLASAAFQETLSEAFQGNVSEAIQGMDTELAWTEGPMNKSDLEESFDRLNRQSQLEKKIKKKAPILLSTAINAVQGFGIQLGTESPLVSEAIQETVSGAFQGNVSVVYQGNVSEAIQGMDNELAWTEGQINKSDLEESFDRLNRQSQLENQITKKASILLSTAINTVQGFRIQLGTENPLASESIQETVSEAFRNNISEAIQGMDTELAWTDGPMNKSDLEESFDRLNRQSQLANKITKKAPILLSTAMNAVQRFRIQLNTESPLASEAFQETVSETLQGRTDDGEFSMKKLDEMIEELLDIKKGNCIVGDQLYRNAKIYCYFLKDSSVNCRLYTTPRLRRITIKPHAEKVGWRCYGKFPYFEMNDDYEAICKCTRPAETVIEATEPMNLTEPIGPLQTGSAPK